jgi:hypothetical protein
MHSKQISLRQLQSLIGLLNLTFQAAAPGRAFCRRLIDATCSAKKNLHKIRVSQSMREDIKVWQSFLSQYNGITVMLDTLWTSNDTIELFTDSAGGRNKGFVIYFQGKWDQSLWLITGFATRLTRWVSLVEHELPTFPEHLSSPQVFSEVRVSRSLVLGVCFVDRCLSFCTFSFGHRVFCSSSIYDSDCRFGVFKHSYE